MSQTIKLKRNKTNSATTPSTLLEGEIAVNILDKSLFVGDGNNVVRLYIDSDKYFNSDGYANNAVKFGGNEVSHFGTAAQVTAINKSIESINANFDNYLSKISGGEVEGDVLIKAALKMNTLYLPNSNNTPSDYQMSVGSLGSGADTPSSGGGGIGKVSIYLGAGTTSYDSDAEGKVVLPPYPVIPTLSAVATSGSYDDLSDKPTIPSAVTESTVAGWGFTKNTGTYSKPSTGIPKTDLASAVQTLLDKADSALQEHQDLSGYQTKITSTNKLAYSLISGTPTSLPASDVYSWAKKSSLAASDVPNLDWSKITSGKPTTLAGYGITNAFRSIRMTDVDVTNTTTDLYGYWGAMSTHHGINSSYYHILNFDWENDLNNWISQLAIPTGSSSLTKNYSIYYRNRHSSTWSDWVKVLDSNNYSDYALPKSGGTLQNGTYTAPLILNTTSSTEIGIKLNMSDVNKGWVGYSASAGYGTYLYNSASNKYIGIKDDGTPHYQGNTLIHSGNIGSQSVYKADKAEKLVYSDGTIGLQVLSGGVIKASNRIAFDSNTTGICRGSYYSSALSDSDIAIAAPKMVFYNGNVLVGTTEDSGEKLQVNGTSRFTQKLYYRDWDATLKIYQTDGYHTGSHSETIAFQSCFDGEDPETSSYPSNYAYRTIIALQPRGGRVAIGKTTADAELDVSGNISASGYQLPTSAPSNPVSGGYYLYVGTLGTGATIS